MRRSACTEALVEDDRVALGELAARAAGEQGDPDAAPPRSIARVLAARAELAAFHDPVRPRSDRERALAALCDAVERLEVAGDRGAATALAMAALLWRRSWA